MGETFFISDTHFSHKNILEYESRCRPFNNIEEHDKALIENWNAVVTDKDKVFHLGDVAFGGKGTLKRIMPQLKGTKYLIQGNHDSPAQASHYFHNVFPKWFIHSDYKIVLCHYPLPLEEFPFSQINAVLHGHVHSKGPMFSMQNGIQYINISCENTDLMPIPLSTILNILGMNRV